jgi:chromosome segregation ATPase
MSKASPLFLAVLLFCSASMYGCTNQKNGAASAKIRDMEARFTKLEEDYHAVVAASEAARKKLAQADADRAALSKEVDELRVVVQERDDLRKERDDLRKQLTVRTGERDNIQTQLVQFREDLQSIIGRVDGVLNTSNGPGKAVTVVPASRQSK